jgi:hypothetical protein
MKRIVPYLVACGVAIVALAVTGCAGGARPGSATVEPSEVSTASPSASASMTPQAIRTAFIARVTDPDVAFHAEYQLGMTLTTEDGDLRATGDQSVDVVGESSSARLELTAGTGESLLIEAIVVDGRTYLRTDDLPWSDISLETASFGAGMEPNPFAELDESRLTYIGTTDDGLHEFDIRGWILGEVVDPFADDFDPDVYEGITPSSTRTRVMLDDTGMPHSLEVSYAFTDWATFSPGVATLSGEFTFGQPASIEAPSVGG